MKIYFLKVLFTLKYIIKFFKENLENSFRLTIKYKVI